MMVESNVETVDVAPAKIEPAMVYPEILSEAMQQIGTLLCELTYRQPNAQEILQLSAKAQKMSGAESSELFSERYVHARFKQAVIGLSAAYEAALNADVPSHEDTESYRQTAEQIRQVLDRIASIPPVEPVSAAPQRYLLQAYGANARRALEAMDSEMVVMGHDVLHGGNPGLSWQEPMLVVDDACRQASAPAARDISNFGAFERAGQHAFEWGEAEMAEAFLKQAYSIAANLHEPMRATRRVKDEYLTVVNTDLARLYGDTESLRFNPRAAEFAMQSIGLVNPGAEEKLRSELGLLKSTEARLTKA